MPNDAPEFKNAGQNRDLASEPNDVGMNRVGWFLSTDPGNQPRGVDAVGFVSPDPQLVLAPEPAHRRLVPFPRAAALALGKNLASPIAAIGHLLSELPAEQDVPAQIRNIINGNEHIELRLSSIASKRGGRLVAKRRD
jgi:hypothetical protein